MSAPGENHPAATDGGDAIMVVAAEWLAQRGQGLTPAQERALAQWRRADPRHAAALARLEQGQALLDRLPFAAERLADLRAAPAAPSRPRRWRFAGGCAAAAALAIAGASGGRARRRRPRRSNTRPQPAATSACCWRTAPRSSSRESAARVQFSSGERRVILAAGEAHFSVARDPARPLCGRGRRRGGARGRHGFQRPAGWRRGRGARHPRPGANLAAARVRGGRRPATAARGRPAPRARARGGGRARADRDGRAAAIAQALAWQERKLVFADTPLHEVVAQFNRRNRTQLVLGDPALAARPVGGTFAAENVEAFVRLLETAGDIAAATRGEREIVLHRKP